MSTIASSRISSESQNQQLKNQSLHTLCNMINALFKQNYQKIYIFLSKIT